MAQNISLMGASYADVPAVELPKTGGGTARFTDTSGVTAVASDVASGKVFVDANGEEQTGTASGGGSATLIAKSITENGTYDAQDDGADGYSEVTVNVAGGGEWWDTPDPTDGKTHIWIEIPQENPESRRTMTLRVRNPFVVDWGDGTVQSLGTASYSNYNHKYEKNGNYEIVVSKSGANVLSFGGGSSYCLVGSSSTSNLYKGQWVKRIFLGDDAGTTGCSYMCQYFYNLKLVSLRDTATAEYLFRNCYGLEEVKIRNPTGEKIMQYSFHNNYNLKHFSIAESVTTFNTYALANCLSLTKIVIPAGVTNIYAYAFAYCYALAEIHLKPTTPPTLANTNAFQSLPSDCKIYVPYSEDHSILEAYKAATNWSNYASKMVEEEENDEN